MNEFDQRVDSSDLIARVAFLNQHKEVVVVVPCSIGPIPRDLICCCCWVQDE